MRQLFILLLWGLSINSYAYSPDYPSFKTPADNNKVRLAKITVDPARLETYNAYLKEEIEASMRLEPGVLTIYAVSEKEHPHQITILEIYADEAAYQSHIKTPHFLKYKQGTSDMIETLELIEVNPLIPGLTIKDAIPGLTQ